MYCATRRLSALMRKEAVAAPCRQPDHHSRLPRARRPCPLLRGLLSLSSSLPGHCILMIIKRPPPTPLLVLRLLFINQVNRECRFGSSCWSGASITSAPSMVASPSTVRSHGNMAGSASKFCTIALSLCMMCRLSVGLHTFPKARKPWTNCELCGGGEARAGNRE
jgi:hypothetical protein